MNPNDIKGPADVARWLRYHVEWSDEASRDMALRAGDALALTEQIDAEADRLDRDRGYEGRDGLEALLTNIEGTADLARNEQGDELRQSVLGIAAWAVVLLARIDERRADDWVPEEESDA